MFLKTHSSYFFNYNPHIPIPDLAKLPPPPTFIQIALASSSLLSLLTHKYTQPNQLVITSSCGYVLH